MPPSLIFIIILAVTIGLLFHGIAGRRIWQLPLFVMSAIAGMLGGQAAGTLAGWYVVQMGNIPLVPAVVGCLIAIGICWFFTTPLEGVGRLNPGRR